MSLPHEVSSGRKVKARKGQEISPLTLQVPPESVVLVRPTGVEFLSARPLELFRQLELHLRMSGADYRAAAVVVSCQACSPKVWRVALLFSSGPEGSENLSLAA